jgi:hypothetical protein
LKNKIEFLAKNFFEKEVRKNIWQVNQQMVDVVINL